MQTLPPPKSLSLSGLLPILSATPPPAPLPTALTTPPAHTTSTNGLQINFQRRTSDADCRSAPTSPRVLPTVVTSFHWRFDGEQVFLTGSFNGWKERVKMTKEPGSDVFSVTMELPVGIHSYKFIVDGEWRYAEDQQTVGDDKGNVNNCMSVTLPVHDVHPHIPTHWTPNDSANANDAATHPTSPRDKPLKNQFLMSGVYSGDNTSMLSDRKLILVMVGLPARGKSFVSRKLARYLTWLGYSCKVFNLGNYRREQLGSFHSHDFFRPDNPEGIHARNMIANAALDDVMGWLKEGGRVAIYDGTNSTIERRKFILNKVKQEKHTIAGSCKVIFVEIICNNPEIIEANILGTKLTSPDYVGVDKSKIISDFRERIAHYEQAYQTLDNDELSYIKIFEVGRQIVTNRIYGYLPSRIVFFLNNLHIIPRPIYLVRHGESEYNKENRLGGDPALTKKGREFSVLLNKWMKKAPIDGEEPFDPERDLLVWSSTTKRAVQTAATIKCAQYVRWKAMEEINVGICDGLTEEEFQKKYPEEYRARNANRLTYRFPRGESYEDVIRRLEPVLIELERQRKPVLVVAHRAVLRCLIGYFKNMQPEEIPNIDVPLHTVIKLYPRAYGTQEERYPLMDEGTHPSDQHPGY